MGTSTIEISTESLGNVVRDFSRFGVQVIGSKESEGFRKSVVLVIDGEIVPDAAKVCGQQTVSREDGIGQITLRFEEI
jgi:hypothetical protein